MKNKLIAFSLPLIAIQLLLSGPSSADDVFFSTVTGSAVGNAGNVATPSLARPYQHDYSPTVLWDADAKKYRMWWCGSQYVSPQNPGNEGIWYSETISSDLNSGWSTPVEAVDPEENGLDGGFDDGYMCDPSVIRHAGYYYLYYTGIGGVSSSRVGVIRSSTGLKGSWAYVNGGVPIVSPFNTSLSSINGWYGAGTPSVVKVDDWFYLYFQDDTFCNGTTCASPTPQGYILRSKDPAFPLNNREELRVEGGVVSFYADDLAKAYPVWGTTNADLIYHDGLKLFLLGNTGASINDLGVIFFNRSFAPAVSPVLAQYPLATGLTFMDAYWTEGPGFLRNTLGHIVYDPANYLQPNCELKLRAFRSVGTPLQQNSPTWELSFAGVSKVSSTACGSTINRVPLDYDGDRRSDPVVFRQNQTDFWIRKSSTWEQVHDFGSVNSISVQGDFDGDGNTDLAEVTPSGSLSGYLDWHWRSSRSNTSYTVNTWGLNSDRIVVGDYNGDGKDDFAVWRNSTATWWVLYSQYPNSPNFTNGWVSVPWGNTGDIPAPADFDADGVDDFVVQRPSNAKWSVYFSSTGTASNYTFHDYCMPIPGDFDNDGLADHACWRTKNRKFYVLLSRTGVQESYTMGVTGDVPVLGDFNGDGVLDFNLWRPSNGNWYSYIRGIGELWVTQWGGLVSDQVPMRYASN